MTMIDYSKKNPLDVLPGADAAELRVAMRELSDKIMILMPDCRGVDIIVNMPDKDRPTCRADDWDWRVGGYPPDIPTPG